MGRYSKLDPIKIPTGVKTYRPPSHDPAPPIYKLDQRLDSALVAEIAAAYESGIPSTQLAKIYSLRRAVY